MSDQRKRRQFLADALFAGGSLAAAAVATRWFLQEKAKPAVQVTAAVPPEPPLDEPRPQGSICPIPLDAK